MAFDGLMIKGIISELNKNILNSRVEKIYQPNQDEVLIKLYGTTGKSNLRVVTSSDNYRIHLTNSVKGNPFTAPNFCMVLRKYLTSARLRNMYTNGLERTVFIDFDSIDNRPVDLIFLLLSPEGSGADHLTALAMLSRILKDETLCNKLRNTSNITGIYALLNEA